MELAEPLFVEGVPYVDKTITTTSGKSVVATMKGNSINRVDVLSPILLHTMALKSILLLLNFCICVQIFHSYPAMGGRNFHLVYFTTINSPSLYGAEHKALAVGKATNGPGLVLEARCSSLFSKLHVLQVPAYSQVHISQSTLQFLQDGEFEVTDGNGGSRDPFLKEVTTYLIREEAQNHTEPSNEAVKSGQYTCTCTCIL